MAGKNVVLEIDAFEMNKAPQNDDDILLRISGTKGGILGRILTFLQISPRSNLTVTRNKVVFDFAGLDGNLYIVCPFDAVRCSVSGVSKPLWRLFFGIAFVLGAVGALDESTLGALVAFGIGIYLLATFIMIRHLVLLFSTGEILNAVGLEFNATGLPDGRKVESDLVLEAIELINYHLADIHDAASGTQS